jgi:hypothetical protein
MVTSKSGNRRRRALAAAAASLAVSALFVAAPPASAHTTSYCGHGESKTYTGAYSYEQAVYLSSYAPDGIHHHRYRHDYYDGYKFYYDVHRSARAC